jgi:putative ABC transport system permease protein
MAQAQADLAAVQQQLAQQYPQTDGQLRVAIRPLKEMTVAESARSLWLLFGSVTLLLLIACTNIAALLVARTSDREQEISIRLSLGASRLSVMTRLLAEVFVLALAGSGLGLLVAAASSGVFQALAKNLPRVEEIALNWTLVAYSMACAVGATLVCGVVPALRIIRRSAVASTPQNGRGLVSTRSPLQWLLVGVQISLSVALLAGAGLLLRSFHQLGRVSTGFETARILTFRISANWAETTDLPGLRRRIDGTLDALRALPGVENAATTLTAPGIAFAHPEEFRVVEGAADADKKILAHSRYVSNGYFETLRIALLAGESCRPEAAGMTTVLVNRSFVDAYLGGSSAMGFHLENVPKRSYSGPAEIRGVVADAREEGLNQPPAPLVYWCNSGAMPSPLFVLRTSVPPLTVVENIRSKVHELEPLRSVYEVAPLADRLDEAFAENRLRTVLLTFFALTAISLACLGAYGTLSYFVNIRRREVALRIALGARRAEIVGQFFGMGMRVCLIGGLVGLAFALAAGRTLAGVLYGVSSSDPLTLATVIFLVLLTGALASLLPALRAARVHPMQVLRDE